MIWWHDEDGQTRDGDACDLTELQERLDDSADEIRTLRSRLAEVEGERDAARDAGARIRADELELTLKRGREIGIDTCISKTEEWGGQYSLLLGDFRALKDTDIERNRYTVFRQNEKLVMAFMKAMTCPLCSLCEDATAELRAALKEPR